MNLHSPASEMSRAELEMLSSTEQNIMTCSTSKPNIYIVQDALLASYLMTKTREGIPRHVFFNICMKTDWTSEYVLERLDQIRQVYEETKSDIPVFSGKGLFSLLLPIDFNYHMKNNAIEDEPIVVIERGVLLRGAISKANLGGGHSSLIALLHKEYSSDRAMNFIDNVQFIANEFMMYHGFSIGIEDCVASRESEIENVVAKCFVEAEGIEATTYNSFIRESKVNMALSRAKDIGMKLAKDALDVNNNFLDTVRSGSKGDFFNIAQIMGLLGQQNISGKRIQAHLNKGKRTLPHYPHSITNKGMEYDSMGFVKHSFIHGLTPEEFWFHAMSGREGITDTALKTAHSGYIQRKMIKIMEDAQVKYDHTVRNSVGSIIQFAYGEDNLCGTQTVILDKKPVICNIKRLADQLNTQFETTKH